eukprot:242059-Ditylum_brightwellii.AAC.1
MGLVHLPCMHAYWSIDHYIPQHRVMKELGIAKDCFLSMCCNCHVYYKEDMDMQAEQKEGEANNDYDSDDDCIIEFAIDHDQEDHDGDAASDEECSIEEEEKCGEHKEGSPSEKKIWYFKLKHLVGHVRDASF